MGTVPLLANFVLPFAEIHAGIGQKRDAGEFEHLRGLAWLVAAEDSRISFQRFTQCARPRLLRGHPFASALLNETSLKNILFPQSRNKNVPRHIRLNHAIPVWFVRYYPIDDSCYWTDVVLILRKCGFSGGRYVTTILIQDFFAALQDNPRRMIDGINRRGHRLACRTMIQLQHRVTLENHFPDIPGNQSKICGARRSREHLLQNFYRDQTQRGNRSGRNRRWGWTNQLCDLLRLQKAFDPSIFF